MEEGLQEAAGQCGREAMVCVDGLHGASGDGRKGQNSDSTPWRQNFHCEHCTQP